MALYRLLRSVLHSEGEGTALYRPLCLVFYRRGGERLSTVSCVWFCAGISITFRGGDAHVAIRLFPKVVKSPTLGKVEPNVRITGVEGRFPVNVVISYLAESQYLSKNRAKGWA